MAIKEEVIKPAPTAEDMDDRGDEAALEEVTIATEGSESTKEIKEETAPIEQKNHSKKVEEDVEKKHHPQKPNQHKTRKIAPMADRPVTENDADLCCRFIWEGGAQCCVWSCILCCCGESR